MRSGEVVPVSTLPAALPEWAQPPEDLPIEGRPIWDAVVAELLPRRLRPAQMEGVRMMVTAAVRYRQAAAVVNEYGVLLRTQRPGVPQANPALKVEKEAAATFLRLADAYGLTPAAQMRLGLMQLAGQSILASIQEDLADPWDE